MKCSQLRFSSIEFPPQLPQPIDKENGKPLLNPLGGVKKTMINLGISKSHVSLADENDYAIAFAILEL